MPDRNQVLKCHSYKSNNVYRFQEELGWKCLLLFGFRADMLWNYSSCRSRFCTPSHH